MNLLKLSNVSSLGKSQLSQVSKLRTLVWKSQVETTAFEDGEWTDTHDQHGFHWGVFNQDEELIASARLCIHQHIEDFPDYDEIKNIPLSLKGPIGMMTRLVVHPNYQRKGVSGKLDQIRIEKARELGAKMVVLQAPEYRGKILERQGFKCLGEAIDLVFVDRPELRFFLYVKYL